MRHSPQNSELREIGLSSENQTMKSVHGGSEKGEAKSPHRGRVAPAPSGEIVLIHLEKEYVHKKMESVSVRNGGKE